MSLVDALQNGAIIGLMIVLVSHMVKSRGRE